MSYHRNQVNAPTLSGLSLSMFTTVTGSVLGGPVRQYLLKEAGITALLAQPVDLPALSPRLDPVPSALPTGEPATPIAQAEQAASAEPRGDGFKFRTVADFAAAYKDGKTNPKAIAEAIIEAVQASDAGDKPMRLFIAHEADDLRQQAEASAARIAAGKPLSILEGVPIAVKDELDQVPYPTTVGTRFLGTSPVSEDATPVARLRAAGALLIGKANMHEIGIGVTGLNPHHGVCRNPYNPAHHTGGSSSGTAATTAAGLCPIAIGADGGGSIRMPAAFCGMVGLKATWGRVSEHGAAPLTWRFGHVGPIAATARDCAAAYTIIAGEDAKDPLTRDRPPVHVEGIDQTDLTGVKLGVYKPWFEDADANVVGTCRDMLDKLVGAGAELVEIEIPGLEAVRTAHLIIIASEMYASQLPYLRDHRRDYGLDVQFNLSLASQMTSQHFVHALRHRNQCTQYFREALSKVDAIVTPTTGCTAPPIPEAALPKGESNLVLLDKIMRYAAAANLTGFPAISFPAGYDQGLPIGLQVMARPWEEHLLLRIAHTAEGLITREKPQVWFDVLA